MKLLQHFKELTVNPKNAKELKALILELALRGRLTNNFSTNRQKKQNDTVEGYYELPKDWYWDKFDNISDFQMGKTPPSKEMEYWEGKHPWISIADMYTYSTIIKTKKTLSDKGLTNYFKNGLVKKGTLIMSFKLTIGKTSILGVDACHNEAIISIYPKENVLQEYLFLFLPIISHWGVQVNALMGKTLNKGKIQNMNIPIPPLEEQKEIVKVVKALFKEVEQLEQLTVERISLKEDFVTSALNQLTTNNVNQEWTFLQDHFKSFFNETTNIKKLRETVLQLAVQGKLTADWRANNPDTEDASVLLKRIQIEKAQLIKDKKIKKEKALPKITNEKIPYELPEGWVWCRFGDLITFLNGYAFKSSTYVQLSEYQIIRLGNVKSDNFLINTKEAYVPESIGKETLAYQLYKDDILTTLTGTKDKRDYCYTCLVKDEHLEDKTLLLNQRVGCIRAIDKSSSELLNKFLKSEIILNQLFETETGTANQGNIGSTSFKNLVFPFPPLEEQKAIVQKVNALMGLCDALEQEVQQSQEHSEQLMQSCLREVFEDKETKVYKTENFELGRAAEESYNYKKD